MELQPFATYEDMILLAVKVEKQRKRGTPRVGKPYTLSFSYITKSTSKPREKKESTIVAADEFGWKKFETPQPSTRTSDIKFGHIASKCPNKRVMIVRESFEEVVSEEEPDPELEENEEQVTNLASKDGKQVLLMPLSHAQVL